MMVQIRKRGQWGRRVSAEGAGAGDEEGEGGSQRLQARGTVLPRRWEPRRVLSQQGVTRILLTT